VVFKEVEAHSNHIANLGGSTSKEEENITATTSGEFFRGGTSTL
jgi:hypothetical protein